MSMYIPFHAVFQYCCLSHVSIKENEGIYVIPFILIFATVPMAFLGIGIGYILYLKKRKKKCTERLMATVVEIETTRYDESGPNMRAVYRYTYNGDDYIAKSSITSSFICSNVGRKVELFIDPDDPERTYCPSEAPVVIALCSIFAAVGLFGVLLLTYVIIKLI